MEWIDPTKRYQVNGQVFAIDCAFASFAVGNNQAIVAGVTGRRHRVMGFLLQSQAAAIGTISLKDSNAGTVKILSVGPSGAAGPPFLLPVIDGGYFDTVTGSGVYVDVFTNAIHLTVFYISYVP